jgi:hypothetical protein
LVSAGLEASVPPFFSLNFRFTPLYPTLFHQPNIFAIFFASACRNYQ